MSTRTLRLSSVCLLFNSLAAVSMVQGDEGMWLFNDLPRDRLQSTYGFQPTDAWARHVMLSSVRFNSGGSASFVSSNGLVITNHHVASDTLHKLSTKQTNYHTDGFLAESFADELKAPDLELNQLVSIEDVTDRVNKAVTDDMKTADAVKARRAVIASIEKESNEATGLRSDVVTLFGGAKYHLYRYKKYTDVRLVWAPESKIAFFGGDADNFEYPRYNLDVTIFRVYENDEPAKIEHFLKWSNDLSDGDLVFVSGNPGRTQRIFTVEALKYLRDHRHPYVLDYLRRMEIMLQQYGFESDEASRQAEDDLLGVQNGRKAYTGMLLGLQNPAYFATKQAMQEAIRTGLASHGLQSHQSAWEEIAKVQAERAELLNQSASFNSRLYGIAAMLVEMAAEDQKPNESRLPEYRETGRDSLEQGLFSPAPIYEGLERVKLADAIGRFIEQRGGDDPLVQRVLDGKGPRQRAAELVAATKLGDVELRKELARGGQSAIDVSGDPMIKLALIMDEERRRLRKINDELDEIERQAYAKITAATVAVQGTSTYPDATFTLRLAFGKVAGYQEDGRTIPPMTTMGGAFAHQAAHGAKSPWVLPDSWMERQEDINPSTPFNFVCTADIIGGNSGSPVINREAEFVGIIFDGNIQSLTSDFFYSDEVGRAVSVHAAAIMESLRKIYDANALADQLGK